MPRHKKSEPVPPTNQELDAIDLIARVIEVEAWAEYDAGHGRCSNMSGTAIVASIKTAKRLITAYPNIVQIVLKKAMDDESLQTIDNPNTNC